MKFSSFEVKLDFSKGQYYKKAGEVIDTYAVENNVMVDTTEELVQSVAKTQMLCDILKGVTTAGIGVTSTMFAHLVKDYSVAYFAVKIIGKIFGGVSFIVTEALAILAAVKIGESIDIYCNKAINKMISEATTGVKIVDVVDVDVDSVEPVESETETNDDNDDTEDETAKSDDDISFSSKLISFGICTYVVLALVNWAIETYNRITRLFCYRRRPANETRVSYS